MFLLVNSVPESFMNNWKKISDKILLGMEIIQAKQKLSNFQFSPRVYLVKKKKEKARVG